MTRLAADPRPFIPGTTGWTAARAVTAAGRTDAERTRVLVPPTLAIEVISPGHESHDRRTKRH